MVLSDCRSEEYSRFQTVKALPNGHKMLYSVASTSMQSHDVMCPLGEYIRTYLLFSEVLFFISATIIVSTGEFPSPS